MNINLHPKEARLLLPTDIIFQTTFWSHVKSRLGWTPLAFDFVSQDIKGDVLALTKTMGPGITVVYVPQGPEFAPDKEHYGFFLEELSEAMTEFLGSEASFIRYDLPWESQYEKKTTTEGTGGQHFVEIEPRLQEMRMNFGTAHCNLRKAPLDLTVADTLILDLTDSEEEMLGRMKPKTRYNIRLSRNRGVRVFASSAENLPAFYDLYVQTARRNNFYLCGYDHFSALFSIPRHERDSSEVHFLLAEHNRDVLAGAIIGISGLTATYLFGASSNQNRNFMGSYAVQWSATQLARSKGCTAYDMGAISPSDNPEHPFHGMRRFKTGFGGEAVHRSGSWDYPLNQENYMAFRNAEVFGMSE